MLFEFHTWPRPWPTPRFVHTQFSQMKRFPLLWLNNPFDLLLYDQNTIGSSSEIFGYLRKSSVTFGNFQKMFGNICPLFRQLLKNLRKSLKSVQKSFGKLSKTSSLVCLYNKQNITYPFVDRVQLDISLLRCAHL